MWGGRASEQQGEQDLTSMDALPVSLGTKGATLYAMMVSRPQLAKDFLTPTTLGISQMLV